jgi:hypothetical protein
MIDMRLAPTTQAKGLNHRSRGHRPRYSMSVGFMPCKGIPKFVLKFHAPPGSYLGAFVSWWFMFFSTFVELLSHFCRASVEALSNCCEPLRAVASHSREKNPFYRPTFPTIKTQSSPGQRQTIGVKHSQAWSRALQKTICSFLCNKLKAGNSINRPNSVLLLALRFK